MGRLGIFVGAGISAAAPSGLPLGDDFHDLLLTGCQDAAGRYALASVTDDGLRLLRTSGRRNILGCIEDCLPDGTTAGVLDCMRVWVPAEAHLLCAMHAAYGDPIVTINFDNGIELAYDLLTGQASLPPDVPVECHGLLRRWRRRMPDRGPLRVVSTPAQLAARIDPATAPTLVKLRGSVDQVADDTVIPLRPALEDMESTRLDEDRFAALGAVAGHGHLLVTGHSGRDLDCFESLRRLLRPGRFTWAAPGLEPAVVARIAAIDPGQPGAGTAETELRAGLPDMPRWCGPGGPASGFATRFAAWWSTLPPAACAEAYAWMLADAGRYDEPIAVVRGLLRAVGRPGLPLRLADLLVRRGRPDDLAEADRIYRAALADPRPYPRFYVRVRRMEARPDLPPAALLTELERVTVRLAEPGDDVAGRAAVRCVALLSRLIRERGGGPDLLPVVRRALAVAAGWSARRGLATRQTDLELESLATAAPPLDTVRLDAVERAYAHRGDAVGLLRVAAVRDGHRSGICSAHHREEEQADAGSTPEAGRFAGVAAAGEPPAGAAAAA